MPVASAKGLVGAVNYDNIRYLAGWRMTLGADLLRDTEVTVGYEDAFAFRVAFSRAGSWPVTKFSAVSTAFRHELVDCSTQVCMTLEKPASLPPIVMLTSVVPALSAATWLLVTSAVVAPEQATELKLAGAWASAHCSG